jgi:eukaryotic-like serine/threonine-protein kinase
MPSQRLTSHPPVPIAMGTGDTRTEEGRAFYQSRLALLGQWICLVSGSFLVFFGILRTAQGIPPNSGVVFHAIGTALAGLMWGIGVRTRLSMTGMHWVDAAGTWLVCASFAMMAVGYARSMTDLGDDASQAIFVGLLATTYTLLARAIAIPSTTTRTLAVGLASMAPLFLTSWHIFSLGEALGLPLATTAVDVVTWQLGGVAMSVVASRVIFGLRAEVAESRRLGQYTLREKVGEGGMGAVYRAHHAMLRRPTAIKLLPPEKAGAENIQRFEREVQLTASLTHPNTVAIFDYGRTLEGVFYYAMEYLDGINLDQLVRQDGPQPEGRVVRIMRQVSGALAEAHHIGLVHRDIKPANIILCERGGSPDVAKVVDFGLVKRFRAGDADVTLASTTEQTLLGTPLYMAPETAAGSGELDARSDLYALGAVAYLLLTGTPVFQGESVVEILAHHLHTPPEPPSRRSGRAVPPELEQLILRCLAKNPDERPSSAKVLRDYLGHLQGIDEWSDDDAARWWLQHRRRATGTPVPESAGAIMAD